MFDFDDTLVESEAIKDNIFKEIFARFPMSAEAAWEFHRQNSSKPRAEKFAWLATREFPHAEERQRGCLEECLKEFGDKSRQQVATAPEVRGATALLSGLFGKVPLFVASVNPQEELDFQIRSRGWDSYLTAYFGNPPLPKPAALKRIAFMKKVDLPEILFIGDSQGDREAAKAAGTSFWMRKKEGRNGEWVDGEDLADKLEAYLQRKNS